MSGFYRRRLRVTVTVLGALVACGCGIDSALPPEVTDAVEVGARDTSAPRDISSATDAAVGDLPIIPAPPPPCPPGGWKPSNPNSDSNALLSIWGSGPDDAWAAGEHGTLLHWNGAAWQQLPRMTREDYFDIWGAGKNDVWFGGPDGYVLHWDGSKWTYWDLGRERHAHGLWGSGQNDIWAVGGYGPEGFIRHWSGRSWDDVPLPFPFKPLEFRDVWGSSAKDVWVVGFDEDFLHWDGKAWSRVKRPSVDDGVFAVWGTSASNVWAVGKRGVALHWDGAEWSEVVNPTGRDLRGVGERAPGEFVAVAQGGGGILRWDGKQWREEASGTIVPLFAFWREWAVGEFGIVLHWEGGKWTTPWRGFGDGEVGAFDSVSGSSTKDVWAVGEFGVPSPMRWDGVNWTQVVLDPPSTGQRAVWVDPTGAAWLLTSDGVVLRWKGGKTTVVVANWPDTPFAVWGASANDVWFVGRKGSVHHWDGQKMGPLQTLTQWPLSAVWGAGSNDVWAVGDAGETFHWDGVKWQSIPSGTAGILHSVHGTGPKDVWATGTVVRHWNGVAWTDGGVMVRDAVVRALAPNDVWLVGFEFYHWDGVKWSCFDSGTGKKMFGLWSSGPGDLWAVGERAVILRH